MLHLVDRTNEDLYVDVLWAMHEARRVQFVERSGWSDLAVVNQGEFDPYDDDQAIYVLDLSDEGDLQAGVRTRPLAPRSLLACKFPHLLPSPAPVAPDLWEISRLFTADVYPIDTPRHGEAVHRLLLAAQQAAFARGCRRFVAALDLSAYLLIRNGPQPIRLMGLPVAYPLGAMVAVAGPVSDGSLAALREALGLEPDQPLPVLGCGPPRAPSRSVTDLRRARRQVRETWRSADAPLQ